jgi:rare lipoprotein A
VLEGSEPVVHTAPSANSVPAAVAVTPAAAASASGDFVVQVGAVSDQARAQQYQQRLSQQFSVPAASRKTARWRIQLGPFSSKAQASTIQQRQSEAQLQSFITRANKGIAPASPARCA